MFAVTVPEIGTAVALNCVSVRGPETGTAEARSSVFVSPPVVARVPVTVMGEVSFESMELSEAFAVDCADDVAAPEGSAELATTTAAVFTEVTFAFRAASVTSVAPPVTVAVIEPLTATGTGEARSCASVSGFEDALAIAAAIGPPRKAASPTNRVCRSNVLPIESSVGNSI